MKPKIATLGAYGHTEESFFRALAAAKVGVFCDLRARRGMRGARYSFVNSKRLQAKLREMGIRYRHVKELAPAKELRERQQAADKDAKIGKRARERLSADFARAYCETHLARFDAPNFLAELKADGSRVALFCVERAPEACHRSLVAECLKKACGAEVEHLLP